MRPASTGFHVLSVPTSWPGTFFFLLLSSAAVSTAAATGPSVYDHLRGREGPGQGRHAGHPRFVRRRAPPGTALLFLTFPTRALHHGLFFFFFFFCGGSMGLLRSLCLRAYMHLHATCPLILVFETTKSRFVRLWRSSSMLFHCIFLTLAPCCCLALERLLVGRGSASRCVWVWL